MPNLKEGFIDVPGGKVFYQIFGADKKGTPLLTLHGGPGAPHYMLLSLSSLADERPVIFYDQLGCGKSDHPNDKSLWTVERFIEELDIVKRSLGYKEYHILGASWGTMLAASYMIVKKPLDVKSLIFSGPFLSIPMWDADQREYIQQLPPETRDFIVDCEAREDYSNEQYQNAVTVYYKKHLCRLDPWPDDLNRTLSEMGTDVYLTMWGPSEFTDTGTLKGKDVTPRLKEINVPVLIMCGEHDEATPKTSLYYKGMFKNAELAVINNASHAHLLERPDVCSLIISDFLHRKG